MNTKKPTRRQHIVPRWYLKTFATSMGRIGVHAREQQKRYKVDVKNLAVINHFYDVDHPDLEVDAVEKLLSENEAPASSAVRKLRSSGACELTADERESIAVFSLRGSTCEARTNRASASNSSTDSLRRR